MTLLWVLIGLAKDISTNTKLTEDLKTEKLSFQMKQKDTKLATWTLECVDGLLESVVLKLSKEDPNNL